MKSVYLSIFVLFIFSQIVVAQEQPVSLVHTIQLPDLGEEKQYGIPWGSWSPDGSKILTATDNYVYVWNTQSGQEISRVPGQAYEWLWNYDGSKYVVMMGPSFDEMNVTVRDASTGQVLHELPVGLMFYSDDDTRVIINDSDSATATVYNIGTGESLFSIDFPAGAIFVNWLNSDVLWSSTQDERHLYDAHTGQLIDIHSLPENDIEFASLLSPTYSFPINYAYDERVPGGELAFTYDLHSSGSPEYDYDLFVYLYNNLTGESVTVGGVAGLVKGGELLLEQNKVIVTEEAFGQSRIILWDLDQRKVDYLIELEDIGDRVINGLNVSPSKNFAVLRFDLRVHDSEIDLYIDKYGFGGIAVWNLETRTYVDVPMLDTGEITWHPNQDVFVTSGAPSILWDATKNQLLYTFGDAKNVEWNHDGSQLLVTKDNALEIWDYTYR